MAPLALVQHNLLALLTFSALAALAQARVKSTTSFVYSNGAGAQKPGRFKQHLPDSLRLQHWWANQLLLDQVLEESEQQFKDNLALRSSHKGLQRFIQNTEDDGANHHLYLDALAVPTFHCATEHRLGSWVDGGKWVCLSHYQWSRTPLVVSIGCTGQMWFEEAVYQFLGVGTHSVDFSLSSELAKEVRKKEYILGLHEKGLTGSRDLERMRKEKPDVEWVTVHDILTLVDATYVDIFKLDCEHFCEPAVIADIAARWTRDNVPFGQILMEVHLPIVSLKQTVSTMQVMETLGFRLFHSELNRFYDEPHLYHYEVAYIHESLVRPRKDGD